MKRFVLVSLQTSYAVCVIFCGDDVITTLQVKQLHFMEEKAKADFENLVMRTSNHDALQVNYRNSQNHNVIYVWQLCGSGS